MYTEHQIINGLLKLKKELGHEPTSKEIDVCAYLPTSRAIQMRFKGLAELRKKINFAPNINKTSRRYNTMKQVLKRAKKNEKELVERLEKKHGFLKIKQEFPFGDDSRSRCDVAVFDEQKKHVTIYDVFYPSDKHSMYGSINNKVTRYSNINFSSAFLSGWSHSVVLVSANPEISLPKKVRAPITSIIYLHTI